MFTRSTFDFPPGVAAAIVLFVIVIFQITYRFSAMMVVLKGYVKLTSSPKLDQREAKQVQKLTELALGEPPAEDAEVRIAQT